MSGFNNLFKILIYLLNVPVYWLSFIIPKDKNLWIFGAWAGNKYTDNSKYLFEYINKNHPEIKAVWLTQNKESFDLIKKQGYKVCFAYSLMGYLTSIRAYTGIYSTGLYDLNMFTSGKLNIINLWHGTPLKKINYDDKKNYSPVNPIKKHKLFFFPFLKGFVYFSKILMVATSNIVKKNYLSAFKIPVNNIAITGYPRNDAFFIDNPEVGISEFINGLKAQKTKIGIYMPTHRQSMKSNFLELLFQHLEKMNAYLSSENIFLLIKLHYLHLNEIKSLGISYSNIKFINDNDINQDIYSILSLTDFLITDYSSIYFDYLISDKPIIFFPFDKEEYLKKDRELYYNYDEVTPGPKAETWDELLNLIKESVDFPDKYKNERTSANEIFNKYIDGNSCKRVTDIIIKKTAK